MRKTKCFVTILLAFILTISVNRNVSALSLFNTEYISMNVSEMYDIRPESAGEQSFTSSNSKVVTVSSSGKVNAVAAGNATVTAKFGSVK